MGDVLRRHGAIIAAGIVTLIGTVALGMLVLSTRSKAKKREHELKDIQRKKEAVYKFPFALNEANRTRAKKNFDDAVTEYQGKFDEITKRYPSAKEEQLPPIVCVERLKASCEAMRGRLNREGVKFSGDVGKFTFSQYLDQPKLPDENVIPKIMKHLEIIDELVTVVGRSNINELKSLTRNDGGNMDMQKGSCYQYYEYGIRVSGNFDTIRRFVNKLNEARFFFVIREMTVGAQDLTQSMSAGTADANPGGGGGGGGGEFEGPGATPRRSQPKQTAASGGVAQLKENRVAFRSMAAITLDLRVDYVEFVEDKKSVKLRRKKK